MSMDIGGSSGGLKADINVTPLVDVMLVLLIIMMLVAPMLQKGVDVQLPVAANTSDKPDNETQTVVAVDSSNQLWVNGIKVSKSEFTDRVVLIKGDQDASYRAIMEAMDYLHEAQIEDIGLITEPKIDPNKLAGGN